ncbi:hypothetical protein K9M16_01910 [Candidatus Babeliales bacterium]|nr:hypothetical protein [Candidatus Babeliales bacterium]
MGELKIYPKVSKLLAYSLGAIFLIGSYPAGSYIRILKEKINPCYIKNTHQAKTLYESLPAEEKKQFEKQPKEHEIQTEAGPLSFIKKFLQPFGTIFFLCFLLIGLGLSIFFLFEIFFNVLWNFYRLFKYLFNKKPELKIDSVGISNVIENKQFIWEEINKIEVKEGFNWLFFLMPLLYRKKYYYLNIYLKDQNKPFFIYLQNIDQKFDDVIESIRNYKEIKFGF